MPRGTYFLSQLIVLMLLFGIQRAIGQSFTVLAQPAELIDGLAEQADMNTFQANFTESKSMSFMANELVSEGLVAYDETGLIRWEYLNPEQSVMVISPEKTLVLENGEISELKVMNSIMKRIKELIGGCITGDILSDNNYKSSFMESGDTYRVELVPLQRRVKQMISMIQVDFLKSNIQIKSLVMNDPSGDRTTILFNEIQVNSDLPKDVFKLN